MGSNFFRRGEVHGGQKPPSRGAECIETLIFVDNKYAVVDLSKPLQRRVEDLGNTYLVVSPLAIDQFQPCDWSFVSLEEANETSIISTTSKSIFIFLSN